MKRQTVLKMAFTGYIVNLSRGSFLSDQKNTSCKSRAQKAMEGEGNDA